MNGFPCSFIAKPVHNILVHCFERNLGDIHEILCGNPDELYQQLAMQLCSHGLISEQTRDSAYDTTGSSKVANAFAILRAVKARIATDIDSGPPFKTFCAVLNKCSSLRHISSQMMKGTSMFMLGYIEPFA